MALSDAKVRNAKPMQKPFKISDGDGLFLLVKPSGGKYWRMKYLYAGREKLLALGVYPDLGLKEARDKTCEARKVLASGRDPGALKQEAKRLLLARANDNFESVARDWHNHHIHEWTAKYAQNIMKRLETHMFPKLGRRPIAEITPIELLTVLRVIETSGALDMAQRMMQTCAQMFRHAIITGKAERNPVDHLRGALKTPIRKHNAYLKEDDLPEYLCRLENYDGELLTKFGLKLLLLTFVRTTELRGAEWSEFNLDKGEWRIPAERMKMKETHIVPLSRQVLELLKELKKLSGHRHFLFPNQNNPNNYMTNNTMLFALYRMGYHSRTTGHGFRACASTILNENGYTPDVIERQLAHAERNGVRAAYNHAEYLPQRREMMQWWANHIDVLRDKGVRKSNEELDKLILVTE